MVCEIEQGQTKVFRCWYHGWIYDTTGKLLDVTGRAAYGPDFNQDAMQPHAGSAHGHLSRLRVCEPLADGPDL